MKKYFTKSLVRICLILLNVNFFAMNGNAQSNNLCGTETWMKEMKDNPDKHALYFNEQASLSQKAKLLKHSGHISQVADTIAIVVHVLWHTAAENIPDSLIYQQIDILNKDFRRLNADTINTPVPFRSLAGYLPYYFKPVTRTPEGAASNGINRVYTPVTSFTSLAEVITPASGGVTEWPCMNLYCCNMQSSGVAGLGANPGFAAMVNYTYFSGSDNGKVATHEIGHNLGLDHIWGSGNTCSDDDGIADTPLQYCASIGCYPFPFFDSCTVSGNGIMYMNYMDYGPLTCKNIFTQGQVQMMENILTSLLSIAVNSEMTVPLPANDAGLIPELTPSGAACSSSHIKVQIRNHGTSTLTTATIKYKIDNSALQSYSWNGSLANFQTELVDLGVVNGALGSHTIIAYTTNPNGTIDPDHSNDTLNTTYQIVTPLSVPLTEGFEGSTFPPPSWTNYDQDGLGPYYQTPYAFHNGLYAAETENWNALNYWTLGSYNDLSVSPNFSAIAHPILSFYVAYTYNSTLGFSDTLEILVSNDCGNSFTSVYKKYDATLITAPVKTSNFNFGFYPTAQEWRRDSIDLSNFGNSSNAIIKFRDISGKGLQLYLDDINITNSTIGIDEIIEDNSFSLSPNPSHSSVTIETITQLQNAQVEIYNLLGEIKYAAAVSGKQQTISIEGFAGGIYFVKFASEKGNAVRKLIVQ